MIMLGVTEELLNSRNTKLIECIYSKENRVYTKTRKNKWRGRTREQIVTNVPTLEAKR